MAISPLKLSLVLQLYGISESTLLSYEEAGLIVPFRVGAERYYTKKNRVRIELILKARGLGFSLHELKMILDAHIPKPEKPSLGKELIEKQIAQLEDEVVNLKDAIERLRARATEDESG